MNRKFMCLLSIYKYYYLDNYIPSLESSVGPSGLPTYCPRTTSSSSNGLMNFNTLTYRCDIGLTERREITDVTNNIVGNIETKQVSEVNIRENYNKFIECPGITLGTTPCHLSP